MRDRPDRKRLLDRKLVIAGAAAASVIAFVAQSLPPLVGDSATFDEPIHVTAGYVSLRDGDYDLDAEHPPLIKQIAALPLLAVGCEVPTRPLLWNAPTRWRYAVHFLYRANDADRLLLLARIPMVLLAAGLPLLLFFVGRRFFDPTTALVALVLATFSPTLLGHGHLVNTDVSMALLFLATVFAFGALAYRVTPARLVLFCLLVGLSLLTKFNALLLGPVLALLAAWRGLDVKPLPIRLPGGIDGELKTRRARFGALLAALALAGGVGYAMLWAGYGFRFSGMRTPGYTWALRGESVLPSGGPARAAIIAGHRTRALPQSYLVGLGHCLKHAERRRAFLAGRYSSTGWWYYFPVTIALKTPLPLLILGIAGFCLLAWTLIRGPGRTTALCVLVPAAVVLLTAMTSGVNIGLRHVLILYPFLFLAAGAAAAWLARHGLPARILVLALVAWFVAGTVRVAPHYIAYFNEIAGGPERGWRYVVDSNVDWGQDLKRLARFAEDQKIDRLYLSYFGTADPAYHGLRYVALPSFYIFDPPAMAARPPMESGTWVAVSVTNLQGVYLKDRDAFAFLREREPYARIGYSMNVYRLDEPVLAGGTITATSAQQLAQNPEAE